MLSSPPTVRVGPTYAGEPFKLGGVYGLKAGEEPFIELADVVVVGGDQVQ